VNVKTVRALLVLPVLLVILCSCGLLTVSPFPVMLTQTMTQRSFAAEIPDTVLDNFRPFVVESGTDRLILLVGGYPYPASDPWLFVLDESLSLLQFYTINDLVAFTTPRPFKGSSAMVDSDGNLVVGSALFGFDSHSITPLGNTCDLEGRGGLSGSGFPVNVAGENIVNLSASGTTLSWDRYQASWCTLGSGSCQITAASVQLEVRGVLCEPYPAMTDVILVLGENSSDTTHFVRVPRSAFVSGLPDGFMGLPAYPSFTKPHIDTGVLGYTTSGIVAYSYDTQDCILFTFSEPDKLTSLHVGNIDDQKSSQRTSWSWSGGYSCVYDSRTKTLSKVAKWWN
jgi:hypothetical protein